MEALDAQKKQEIEIAKAKLDTTKRKIAETLATISKTEGERQEQLQQWNRTLKDLRSTEGAQALRISKLNADLANMKSILESRTEEHAHLLKTNAEFKEELRALQDDTVHIGLRKKLGSLEDKIKEGYEQLQNMKDAEVLFEMGLGEEQRMPDVETISKRMPFLEEMMRKRKQREEEINFQMEELVDAEKQLDIEIKSKTEQLALLKDRYISLNRIYDMSKKVKDARSKTLMKDKPQ